MNFPVTGALLAVLGVTFFFFAPRYLYLATVFLLPFSAMAVVNVGWGNGEKGVAAWIFMGGLWMLRTAISERPFWRHPGWRLTRRARTVLLGLLASGFVSLLVPLMLNGTAWVRYYRITSSETIPLRLTADRITQTGYFAFGVVFIIFVAVENCDPRRLLQGVRAYIAATIFASLWAFVQLWCILTGHTYPAFLFNNSMGTSAQFYTEKLWGTDLHRISSVAVEPSQLAFSLLPAFLILLMAIGLRRPVLSRKWDIIALLLVASALIISTATTAYAGIVIASCLAVAALARAGAIRWLYVLLATIAAGAAVAFALTVPVISDIFDLVIATKAQSGSTAERLHSTSLAAHYFLNYPIFGLSWNATSSGDLVFEMLASLGVVGFAAFVLFLVDELRHLWRASARDSRWSGIFLPTVCLVVLLSETNGLPFSMGYVWFIWGVGVSAPSVISRQAHVRRKCPAVARLAPRRELGGFRETGQMNPSGAV